MERQQQQPEQEKKQTKTCLACGQPKMVPLSTIFLISKALSGTSTVPQRFLTNPRMPFQDVMEMEFFKSELEDTKKRVEEKRKMPETEHVGRLCRFYQIELKRGPNKSSHIHRLSWHSREICSLPC